MNRHVNAIAGRLSLRPPQRHSLEILDRITEIVPPRKTADVAAALAIIRSEYPTVTDFEREFPSLCFALATGVGKTRLMGAFISYLYLAHEAIHNHRHPVADKARIAQMIFGGFSRCLYPVQKFDSDTERVLSVILDRDAAKWFKPGRGQFQIFYKWGPDQREYQPDFVAETTDTIYMLEPKARNDLQDGEVLAKKDSAIRWCQHATAHSAKHGGKPWKYLLIPHDAIAENMTLNGLAAQFAVSAGFVCP